MSFFEAFVYGIFNFFCCVEEKLDYKQIEALEEVFKRLSFKCVNLEGSTFDQNDQVCLVAFFFSNDFQGRILWAV